MLRAREEAFYLFVEVHIIWFGDKRRDIIVVQSSPAEAYTLCFQLGGDRRRDMNAMVVDDRART